MRRQSSFRRKLYTWLGVLGIAFFGSRWLLRSAYASEQVVARLTAAVGAPVQFEDLDLGFTGSSVSGLVVQERDGANGAAPWLTIGSVDVDLSLWQLFRGTFDAGAVTLRDVRVVLRFDRDGKLLTRIPEPPPGDGGSLPLVRVADGAFTIRRDGRPDETFRNIALEFRGDGPQLQMQGSVNDPDWGPWTILGNKASASAPLAFNLRTKKPVHVTPDLLKRTPFVAATVWDHVTCEGDTPCELALQFNVAPPMNYRVTLEPRNTRVYVRSIDLRSSEASGKVVVADDVLTLENVRGHAAGGELKLRSIMDFRGLDTIMKFTIEAGLLNLTELPTAWGVPALKGELNGKADLEVTSKNGRSIIRGAGEGIVRIFPLLRAIKVQLVADGQKLRFHLGRE